MINIYLDVETFCIPDLKKVGTYKYVSHPSFDPLCYSYAFDNGEIRRWVKGDLPPPVLAAAIRDGNPIRAWNAPFERLVISQRPWIFGLDFIPPITQYRCDMALAATQGYPLELDKAAPAMGLSVVKDKKGKGIMLKLCRSRKPSKLNSAIRWTPETAYDDFQHLYRYCDQDVRTHREIHLSLHQQELTEFEQLVWIHTVLQNDRGLTIDINSAKRIYSLIQKYKLQRNEDLEAHTGEAVTAATQRDRLLTFVNNYQCNLPDLKADTVKNYLKEYGDLDHPTIHAIKIRQEVSRTSTAKYPKMLEMADTQGVVRGNLQYYGAIRTGRFAGRGLQFHNFPRLTPSDPEEALRTIEYAADPMDIGKQLLRSMVIAPPGYDLIVSDFSSIENRVLHWYARDHKTLRDFEAGKCQYREYASERFGIPYDAISIEQRTAMKPVVLALGFKGWTTALISQAETYDIELSEEEALSECKFYRNKYSEVVALWEGWETTAISAVQGSLINKVYEYAGILFQTVNDVLYVTLPSGRSLAYPNPRYQQVTRYWGPEGGLTPKAYFELAPEQQIEYRKSTKYTVVFKGLHNYHWCDCILTTQTLTNNIVQGTARDILCIGAVNVEKIGFPVLATVHDEVISIAPKGYGNLDKFNLAMCAMPEWCKGLPLMAEGYIAQRYKKG